MILPLALCSQNGLGLHGVNACHLALVHKQRVLLIPLVGVHESRAEHLEDNRVSRYLHALRHLIDVSNNQLLDRLLEQVAVTADDQHLVSVRL